MKNIADTVSKALEEVSQGKIFSEKEVDLILEMSQKWEPLIESEKDNDKAYPLHKKKVQETLINLLFLDKLENLSRKDLVISLGHFLEEVEKPSLKVFQTPLVKFAQHFQQLFLCTPYEIQEELRKERERQDLFYNNKETDSETWVVILMEEFGEYCQAFLDGNLTQAKMELIQTISVLLSWAEHTLSNKFFKEKEKS